MSTILGGDRYVSLPLVIAAFNLLVTKIKKTILEMDEKTNRNKVDKILLLAFQAGRDKMLKHYHKTNWVYCSSLILDPRLKVEIFYLSDWGKEIENATIDLFKTIYYAEYSHLNEIETQLIIINNDSNSSRSVHQNDDILNLNLIYKNLSKKKKLAD